ncbi:FGGY-family carbohydrate kinase [Oceanirhabdus sp. W0125-5]|uniref:FGGY-family carbohydrate kinase n=1 Tax=Oceanirhabdus sp. W0125-5 TaxID=2999116 RepID=UPI0022F34194|nr:FGGY-family carbohydrate kinase [Oceanirhabdus sp. W0125-5]WBW97396.1 FGGY-family carbohydrate kinase [Oceanirhabdus sp. W0125-5]
MDKVVLVIDCGTQSTRGLIFNDKGELLIKVKKEYTPYFSDYPGFAEQDPRLYWNKMCECCKDLKESNEELWNKIEAITVTTMRDTCVYLDEEGEIIRPSMLWLDQRMARCEEELPILDNMKFRIVGMKKAAIISRRKSKVNWIKENEPECWDRIFKVMLLSGYFNYRLTGEFIDSIANQVGHIPFDYKKLSWPQSDRNYKWALFGIDKNKLPKLVKPGSIIGVIGKELSEETGINEGVKIVVSGSDKGCETLGVGCSDLTGVSLSFGTTATIQTTSSKYIEPMKFMPAYPAVIPDNYNPEVEIFRGYWMISWFKKEFAQREMAEAEEKGIAPEVLLNERLNEVPPGAQGLILQPYWGPGLKMPEAKGAIIGFGDVHTRSHIYRSIIEGINFGLIEGAEMIENKSKIKIEKVMVSGGGSQSDAICQITADMFNKNVYKGETYEAAGLGGAICAFVALGTYSDFNQGISNMVRYSKVFYPQEKNAEIYRLLYKNVYKRIYPKLKGIYTEIQKITNYPEIYIGDNTEGINYEK